MSKFNFKEFGPTSWSIDKHLYPFDIYQYRGYFLIQFVAEGAIPRHRNSNDHRTNGISGFIAQGHRKLDHQAIGEKDQIGEWC